MSVIQTVEFKHLKAKFVFYTILPVLNNTYVQDSRKYDSIYTSPFALSDIQQHHWKQTIVNFTTLSPLVQRRK